MFANRNRKTAEAVEARIRNVLAGMRPLLRNDHLEVDLVRFEAETRTAFLRFGGGCPDCEMTAATLTRGIEAHLKRRVPEVEVVHTDVGA